MNDAKRLQMEIFPPTDECRDWVVNFPQLAVGSQGETMGLAIDHAVEALQLWVEGCMELGNLDVVLEECGFGDVVKRSFRDDVPRGLIPPTLLESVPCHA
ncbi:MAG: hypothetical protein J5838_06600 [Desulfovibrio sp.]|nr:hypothetical protein [Desulfovibrio sp.]